MTNRKSKTRNRKPIDWENLADDEILEFRIRDLGLEIEGTGLEGLVQRLYSELDSRGIAFRPPCYLADEWLCPDKVPMIGIPFCLAHPRLKRIEQRELIAVEGGTDAECMRLLRHEAGHAVNYAYRLYRRTRWRELFGSFTERYSDSYSFRPYSKRYVNHLEDNYAQAHPDEDFAETFAVWLTPNSRWETRYAGWPVMKKLRYIDHLADSIKGKPPLNTSRETPWAASRKTSTLAMHYERRRKALGEGFPGYYDPSLEQLFARSCDLPDGQEAPVPASRFLRRHKRLIVDSVSAWTGQRKYDLGLLLGRIMKRCDAIGLHLAGPEKEVLVEISAFITTVATSGPFGD